MLGMGFILGSVSSGSNSKGRNWHEEAHDDGLPRRQDAQIEEERHDRRQGEEHEPVAQPRSTRHRPDGSHGMDHSAVPNVDV